MYLLELEIPTFVKLLPSELRIEIVRANAEFYAFATAESITREAGCPNKELEKLQDAAVERYLGELFPMALALMPAAIRDEQPDANGDYPLQDVLSFHFQRL